MVAVFSHTRSSRLDYMLRFCARFFDAGFVQMHIDEWQAHAGPKIWYGGNAPGSCITIEPAGLLGESTITNITPTCFRHPEGYPAFFPTGDGGFDVFAACFFLLSRYEEYTTAEKDMYGRFPYEASLAYRNGFLSQPIIHTWLNALGRKLFGTSHKPPAFSVTLSYDIDMMRSYEGKGWWRNAGGFFRDIMHGKHEEVKERIGVLSGRRHDPFDCFESLHTLHRRHKVSPLYFILAAANNGRYDKQLPRSHPIFRLVVEQLATKDRVGIHPSWRSSERPGLVEEEKVFLEKMAGVPITDARQHYIRLSMPSTYRAFVAAGISNDHSMGYGSINGFRASVAIPYYWYDLGAEKETGLLLHPFCFMDANALYEQKQSAEDTQRELEQYIAILKMEGGTLGTVWHNTILGSSTAFIGWNTLHEWLLRQTASAGS